MLIYGTKQCLDCVTCCNDLDATGTEYIFCEFSENLAYLKEFLKIRDTAPIFEEVKRAGKIGIPCLVYEDGTVSLTWK